MEIDKRNIDYNLLLSNISDIYQQGQAKAISSVNIHLLETYWKIGQYIVEFEQEGKTKAEYGKALLENLSKDLSLIHGKGFSRSNLSYMRLFYTLYPICEKLSHKLSWSHYVELVKIDNEIERGFYEKQSIIENWSIPELKRQKKSSLFLRLAASQDKKGILELAKSGKVIENPVDLSSKTSFFNLLHSY